MLRPLTTTPATRRSSAIQAEDRQSPLGDLSLPTVRATTKLAGHAEAAARSQGQRSSAEDIPRIVETRVCSQELVIGRFADPEGTRVGLGALVIRYGESAGFVFAGNAGTGFNAALPLKLRDALTARIARVHPRGSSAKAVRAQSYASGSAR